MKTKLLFVGIGVVLLAAAVSILVYVNNGKNSMAEIFNANVEALADNESGGFGEMCSQTGNPGSHSMPLCSKCDGSKGNYAMDYVAFCRN